MYTLLQLSLKGERERERKRVGIPQFSYAIFLFWKRLSLIKRLRITVMHLKFSSQLNKHTSPLRLHPCPVEQSLWAQGFRIWMAARGRSSVFARCPAASVPHSWHSPGSPWRQSKVKMAVLTCNKLTLAEDAPDAMRCRGSKADSPAGHCESQAVATRSCDCTVIPHKPEK